MKIEIESHIDEMAMTRLKMGDPMCINEVARVAASVQGINLKSLAEQNERLKKKLHAKYVQEELSLGRSFINAKKYADAMIEDLL